MAKQELLATIRDRYRASCKWEKSRILDEFIAELTSSGDRHHRKHGIRLLGQSVNDWEQQPAVKKGRRSYDEAVREALVQHRPRKAPSITTTISAAGALESGPAKIAIVLAPRIPARTNLRNGCYANQIKYQKGTQWLLWPADVTRVVRIQRRGLFPTCGTNYHQTNKNPCRS